MSITTIHRVRVHYEPADFEKQEKIEDDFLKMTRDKTEIDHAETFLGVQLVDHI